MKMETQLVFQEIKPLCDNVAKNLDLKSIEILDKYITHILNKEKELVNEPISILDNLKEYISFPLFLVLRKLNASSGRKDVLLEKVLQCLNKILSNSYSLDWLFFMDSFVLLFLSFTSSENPQIVVDVSEDCKTEALRNVISLCKCLSTEQRLHLCSNNFRPQLGHAVYICLKIAETEKGIDLRLLALNTLEEIGCKSSWPHYYSELTNKLSNAWSNFLPGIAMTTTRIATAGEIQSHKITVAALQCWQYFVYIVMRDDFLSMVVENFSLSSTLIFLQQNLIQREYNKNYLKLNHELSNKKGNFSIDDLKDTSNCKLKNVVIDGEWVKSTSKCLHMLVKSILSLVSHCHWSVRKCLALWCQSVIQHCSRSLESCIIICLEALIVLKSDPIIDVHEVAENSLSMVNRALCPDNDVKLKELLEERVYVIATKLPTIIKTQDDGKVTASVLQLVGTLEILGNKIEDLIEISSHFQRLLRSLIILFNFDYSDSDILAERFIFEDFVEVTSVKPCLGLSFRYFHSNQIFESASRCCYLIGAYGNLELVTDQCLDLIQESEVHQSEGILVLTLIIQGAVNHCKIPGRLTTLEEKEKIVDSIIDILITLKLLEVPLNTHHLRNQNNECKGPNNALIQIHNLKTSLSVDVAKRNIILVCNTLRLVGTCASFLQKNFDVFLNKLLYSILEKAGESNVLVAHSALQALKNIATACDFDSVSLLIEKSVHLYWFDLSQKLKRLSEYPSSPQVLRVILKCHQTEIKKFIEELVEDVLGSLDIYHTESSLPLLTVLLNFVVALENTNVKGKELPNTMDEAAKDSERSLQKFLQDLDEKYRFMENEIKEQSRIDNETNCEISAEEGFKHFVEENHNSTEPNENITDPEKEKQIPNHIRLVVQIMERCSYLLFVKERKLQVIILETIRYCCSLLEGWENQMLPCFHKIWKPLVFRLKDNDSVVYLKALEICVLMVSSSGDFLRRRFLQELFPSLINFLESQSSASINKTDQSGYFHTPSFKTQIHILKCLPNLVQNLKLSILNANELIRVSLLYLDNQQHKKLIELAFETLQALKLLYPDLLWLSIAFTKGPFRIMSPSAIFHSAYINGHKMNYPSNKILELYEDLSQI